MKKKLWEYTQMEPQGNTGLTNDDLFSMNELGLAGWELVKVMGEEFIGTLIFKREVMKK